MSRFLARSIADRINQRVAYCDAPYADPRVNEAGGYFQIGSTMGGDLREIALSTPESRSEAAAMMRAGIVSAYGLSNPSVEKPFIFQDGIAVIPIHGMLIHRFSQSWGYVTGYNFIRSQLLAAMADDDVELIVYDVNSGGGMVSGLQETVDEIFDARSVKPSVAVVDAYAASAAYWLASAASKVICTPSGMVGSIGAIIVHMSVEKMLEDAGIEVTMIYAGSHKADGWPYQKLSKEAKAIFQERVTEARQTFAEGVARNRKMKIEEVLATEALTYNAMDAKGIGLIDVIETPSKAVAVFLDLIASDDESNPDDEDEQMTTKQTPAATETTEAKPAATTVAETPAQTTTPAVAPAAAGGDLDARIAAAISADRVRSASIRSCPEAAGRENLATTLADQGMSLEQAKVILNAAPKAETNPGNAFSAAMNASKHPNVGPGTTEQAATGDEKPNRGAAMADRMFAKSKRATVAA